MDSLLFDCKIHLCYCKYSTKESEMLIFSLNKSKRIELFGECLVLFALFYLFV